MKENKMIKIRNEYIITITSYSNNKILIKHILKKSDKSIKHTKYISVQKAEHLNQNDEFDVKYLHNIKIKTKPTADLKQLYTNILKNKHILDIVVKLI